MNKLLDKICVILVVACLGSKCYAQQRNTVSHGTFTNDIGVYYYPEQWDKSEWSRDLKKMSELGFTFTHMGEFSWSTMEPEDGQYTFDWLDEALALADSFHLKVILCTPSAAPPAWLSAKHPEILVKNAEGIQMQHGSRQQGSWSSEVYQEYVRRIVTAMAKKYGHDSRIMGWQLDNEPSHYSTVYDYSDAAQSSFRNWLHKKYVAIDSLNKCWGNAFWSQRYSDFGQVLIPNQKALVQAPNPHALLDFQEFTNEERGVFLRLQADILRKFILPGQFITTNYMMQLPHLDPWVNKQDFDFASFTNYPVNSYTSTDTGSMGFRLGSGRDLAFSQEFFRSVNGYTGIMELQPGQVNWGQYNAQPLPGAVRMWIWHSIGLGAKFVCTYRFKQPLSGNEQYHQGIIGTDGITLARGGKEFVQVINELHSIEDQLKSLKHANSTTNPPFAILFDQRSLLDMYNFPHTNRWNGVNHLMDYYTILKSMGLSVVFLNKDDSLDVKKYPVVIAPALQLTDDTFLWKWENYSEQGGQLILTCRTAQKDRDGHLWKTSLQQKIASLIGTKILYNDQLPETKQATVAMGQKSYPWNIWADVLEVPADKKTSVLALYKDQFYAGKVAAVTNATGKGTVTYIGVHTNDRQLEKQLLKNIFSKLNYKLLDLPENIFVEEIQGVKLAVNYSSMNYTFNLSPTDIIMLGSKNVKPGEVLIWTKKKN